jgi:hypothetical protein
MSTALKWMLIVALVGVYVAALYAVLHPKVSPEYRAFFIDRTSTDYLPAKYPSTPESGMMFSRPGLPQWVSGTHGLSVREGLGRWTDEDMGDSAGLTFNQDFSGDVCVEASFGAASWLVGDTILLRMGDQEKPLQIKAADLTDYRVQLSSLHQAKDLNFILPPRLPSVIQEQHNSQDLRRLGISLMSLKLSSGQCSAWNP